MSLNCHQRLDAFMRDKSPMCKVVFWVALELAHIASHSAVEVLRDEC
jgi:hypothetical protein